MNLNKKELEILSDCLLSKMKDVSEIRPVSKKLQDAINSELKILQELNSRVAQELSGKSKILKNLINTVL